MRRKIFNAHGAERCRKIKAPSTSGKGENRVHSQDAVGSPQLSFGVYAGSMK